MVRFERIDMGANFIKGSVELHEGVTIYKEKIYDKVTTSGLYEVQDRQLGLEDRWLKLRPFSTRSDATTTVNRVCNLKEGQRRDIQRL